jgi:hypothetical protein
MARAHHCPAHWPQGEACWPTAIVLHAALKRADELNRLRDLPDTPTRSEVEDTTPKVAGLPSDRSDSDPEEVRSTRRRSSASRLRLAKPQPLSCRPSCRRRSRKRWRPLPRRPSRQNRNGNRAATSIAHATAKPPQARQYTFFEMFFWGPPSQQLTYGNQPQNSQLPAYAQQGGQHQYQPAYTQQAGR